MCRALCEIHFYVLSLFITWSLDSIIIQFTDREVEPWGLNEPRDKLEESEYKSVWPTPKPCAFSSLSPLVR